MLVTPGLEAAEINPCGKTSSLIVTGIEDHIVDTCLAGFIDYSPLQPAPDVIDSDADR